MTGSAARIRDARPAAGVSSWPHDADHSPELSIGRVVEELAEALGGAILLPHECQLVLYQRVVDDGDAVLT